MKIQPLLHRLVVKPEDLTEEDPLFRSAKQAGIQFARTEEYKLEQNRIDVGTVMAIGPSAFRAFMKEAGLEEVPVKVGDKVSFAKYAGKTIMDGEDRYVVLNDEDCVAVMGDGNG